MSQTMQQPSVTRRSMHGGYRLPLILVTTLFFMWGLSYGLLDVLNKHFQDQLHVSKAESGLLQASYFGAYFLAALPAGLFMTRFGYKRGIIIGLALYAIGALLFIPATAAGQFGPFLLALFVIASGLGCLETAANPYVTVLGPPDGAPRRLNLSQSFNGLGSFVGPVIGGAFFFHGGTGAQPGAASVQMTYVVIAAIVVVLAVAFWRVQLPEIGSERVTTAAARQPLRTRRHFIAGVITQFFYIAAQVGVAAFFINYAVAHWQGMSAQRASFLLSIGLLGFTLGRFGSTALMARIAAHRLLLIYALINVILCAVVAMGLGKTSVIALVAVFFFESIMFPTIFALGVKDLGADTKRGASFLVMAIIGGAISPVIMGAIADHIDIAAAYWLPFGCFIVVSGFAWRGHRL